MRISVVLLFSVFLLCCTGAADSACRRLGVVPGRLAAFSLLLCALSPFFLPFGGGGSGFGLASFLLIFVSILFCTGTRGALLSCCTALFSGGLGSLLCSFFPDFSEPGLLLGGASAVFAFLLTRRSRQALLAALLAPLAAGLFDAAAELYYFSYPLFAFGTPAQFDAQIAGALLLALIWRLPLRQGALFYVLQSGCARLSPLLLREPKKWT